MGILDGKRILVAGVTMDSSIGFAVARVAQEQGATVLISNFGRALGITKRIAKRLPSEPPVLELDVTDDEHLARLPELVREHVDGLDGVVHSIAYGNPETLLGGKFLDGPWPDVAQAVQVSAYSLKSLAMACRPLMSEGSSVVGMTFDATVAWPAYDWMGVAKAALESTNRYLARDLGPSGIRSNLVSAGPLKTLAAKAIPGFEDLESMWKDRAPLGWDETNHSPTAHAVVALLSDFFPATTGEIIHVDGGFHAMGAVRSRDASTWNGARRTPLEPVGRPAVAAVRRGEPAARWRPRRASGRAGRPRRSPRGRAASRPATPPAVRARRRRRRRIRRASSSPALPTTAGAPRRGAASRCPARSHRPARRRPARTPAEPASRSSIGRRRSGRCGCTPTPTAVGRVEPGGGDRVVAAHQHDRARAHVLLLAHELRARRARRCRRERLVRVLEQVLAARRRGGRHRRRQVEQPARVQREAAHHLEGAGGVLLAHRDAAVVTRSRRRACRARR